MEARSDGVQDCARSAVALTTGCRTGHHAASVEKVEYTRKAGRRLTYCIEADEYGRFTVFLGDKELLRGRDGLTADGRRRVPNKRKAAGAIAEAQLSIERLALMEEC